ncbi:MAG: protein translocase SEC61 complex subunit gamma [Candidatus Micrarchaeota archaeon]|nr:protein translocase SEC61 complex subunit gamma [Candidatus Micrarchaeota archaeon]MDE1833760.1 protein translocase SEC61 complex subunit gamma [Candidatus Micrarchaeota archaeon]MDE1860064.1 protein translocase SEC61 complex subunit gamma [Candidatus Micrarchaeota archaeon]
MNFNFNPIAKLKSFYADAKHVASVSYKPDTDTFRRTLKIVLLGIIILGILGFLIYVIINNFILAVP